MFSAEIQDDFSFIYLTFSTTLSPSMTFLCHCFYFHPYKFAPLLHRVFHLILFSFSSLFYTSPSPVSFTLVRVCTCAGVCLFCLCVCMYVCVSQCTEVVAGARLLAEDLAAPVAAHLSVAPPIPVPVSPVRAWYQP